MESTVKRKSLALDASVMMCILEMVLMYFEEGPHSVEFLQKITEDYKGKLAMLEEEYKNKMPSKEENLGRKDEQLAVNAEFISNKDAALIDQAYQYALLVRTLYGTM